MTAVVIDGMGGGIGVELVTRLRKEFENEINIIALGINAVATDRMIQAKADKGATGENAIRCSINSSDIILGPIGIIFPNGLMGEVTKEIAEIVMNADAKKILIPVKHPNIKIMGLSDNALSKFIEEAILEAKKILKNN